MKNNYRNENSLVLFSSFQNLGTFHVEFSVLEIIFHFKPAQFICRPHLVQIIRKIYVSKQAVAGGDIIMCINKN